MAAIINVPMPIAVATIPDRVPLALCNRACTASALSGPDQVDKFAKQGTFRRFSTKGKPSNPDHHDQHRR